MEAPARSAITLLLVLTTLCGCSASDLLQRLAYAEELAAENGWQYATLTTDDFDLAAWLAPATDSTHLTIFIEGDGSAWINSRQPSANPTPRSPIGLQLALRHPKGNVAYLARPCQYVPPVQQRGCSIRIWTNERFSEAVIKATDQAISMLKADRPASRLTLVGYSGGGNVAALVTARRTDVARLISVASPLDHESWTQSKRLTPLSGSLNPANAWKQLTDVPQIHYTGSIDKVVDVAVSRSYRARFVEPQHIVIKNIEGFDHHCCWIEAWPALVETWVSATSSAQKRSAQPQALPF
jgi:dienelactone hydrolase